MFELDQNTEILLIIWAFWLGVIGLDLVALLHVRRSGLDPIAALLWVVWIVVAPVVGAVTYFVVQPAMLSARKWPRHPESLPEPESTFYDPRQNPAPPPLH